MRLIFKILFTTVCLIVKFSSSNPVNLLQLQAQSDLSSSQNSQSLNDMIENIYNYQNEDTIDYSDSDGVNLEDPIQELKAKIKNDFINHEKHDLSLGPSVDQEKDLENRNDQDLYDRLLNIDSNIPYLNINFTDLEISNNNKHQSHIQEDHLDN